MGRTLATGFPCLVITMPPSSRWSIRNRHYSLNLDAFMVAIHLLHVSVMSTLSVQSIFLVMALSEVSYSGVPRADSRPHSRRGRPARAACGPDPQPQQDR